MKGGRTNVRAIIDAVVCRFVPQRRLANPLEGTSHMTGIRRRIAQGLVATIVLCAGGLLACGSLVAKGNVWENVWMGLMLVMLGSMFAAILLVIVTYIALRVRVVNHLRRPPLTDQEFAAGLADSDGVDLQLISLVRAHCDRYLKLLGSDRFYPSDRLEEDLHLRDLAPFACDAFCAELEEALGLAEDELLARVATGEVTTFGDLVQAASSLAVTAKLGLPPPDRDRTNLIWDRMLDG
jgi:hypothetical protein